MLTSVSCPTRLSAFILESVMLLENAVSYGETQIITNFLCDKEGLEYPLLDLPINTYVCTSSCKRNEIACAYDRVIGIEQGFNFKIGVVDSQ